MMGFNWYYGVMASMVFKPGTPTSCSLVVKVHVMYNHGYKENY